MVTVTGLTVVQRNEMQGGFSALLSTCEVA